MYNNIKNNIVLFLDAQLQMVISIFVAQSAEPIWVFDYTVVTTEY